MLRNGSSFELFGRALAIQAKLNKDFQLCDQTDRQTDRLTDTSENNTFPQRLWREVIIYL